MNHRRPDRPDTALRLFVAAPLPPDVVERAKALIARLAERGGPVRWTVPERLHLTLAFLGDAVPQSKVPAIAAAIDEACRGFPPLVVGCGGLGRFPPTGRPRVVWLGVSHGAAELARLHDAVADSLEPLGFPRDARRWEPHVTLGRLADRGRSGAAFSKRLTAAIEAQADGDEGRGIIDEAVLFASVLAPTGAAYRALHVTPLGRG